MIIVKDKLGTTEFKSDKKLIRSIYKGRVDTDMSFEHLGKVVEFYRTNEVNGAIIDLRQLYGSFAKIMGYLSQNFYPIAKKSGLKAQAFIVKDDLIIKNLASKLEDLTTNFNIRARIFYKKEDAEEWMDSILK